MYPGSIGQPSANPIIRHFIWTRSISVTVATLQSSFSVVGRLFIYRLWTIWLAVARANRSGISSAIATAISSAMMIKSFRWSSSLGSQLLANCDDWSHLLSIWSCCKTVAHWAVFFSYLLNLVFFFFCLCVLSNRLWTLFWWSCPARGKSSTRRIEWRKFWAIRR